MPNMTGDQLAQQLRRRHPDCKVLYFTGFADQLFDTKSPLWDNEAFIEKPATPTALLEAVSVLLYGHANGPQWIVAGLPRSLRGVGNPPYQYNRPEFAQFGLLRAYSQD
jgi:DNA-binding NarL/FixJ family response regulator